MIATYYLGQIDDFYRNYDDEDLDKLEKNFDDWINQDGYIEHKESVEAVYTHLRPQILANDKILLIGFGAGGFATNKSIVRLANELGVQHEGFKYLGHLLISPPRKGLARLDISPTIYYSLIQDSYQVAQRRQIANNNLEPNLNLLGTRSSLFYGSLDFYLNDNSKEYEAGIPGSSKPKQTMLKHFYDFARAVSDNLINNSFSCCEKRNGELIVETKTIVNKLDNEEIVEILGGFIENGIEYNKETQDLRVDPNAIVCKSLIHTNGTPKISGNVDVRGRIIMGDSSQIRGGSSFAPPIYLDSLGDVIELRGQAVVESTNRKSPQLKGALTLDGTTNISGSGKYEGERLLVGAPTPSIILNSNLRDNKNVKGFYYFSGATIENSEIEGEFELLDSGPAWTSVYGQLRDSFFKGIGRIGSDAVVRDGAKIVGQKILSYGGVYIEQGIVEGIGTEVKGSVVSEVNIKSGAKVNGNAGDASVSILLLRRLNDPSTYTISAGDLSGRGVVEGSNLTGVTATGCTWTITYSNLNGRTLSGGVNVVVDAPVSGQDWHMPNTPGCFNLNSRGNQHYDLSKVFDTDVFKGYSL